jgi:hypothetical protein
VFFSRQDDRPGASKKQLTIAAGKGKTLAGDNPASCREKNTPTPELIFFHFMIKR